jgi:4-amino-4-deoxy-L-arabinose transferase-like glycosyltransferase
MKPRTFSALALVLVLLTMAGTAWISYSIFEHIPHVEDEFANLWQAHVMAENQISLPSPPVPKAFMVPFVVDYQGQRFAKYPPGWPTALSLGVRIGATFFVNPLLAGLSVWLVYRLGSKITRPEIGLLAALLAASSPMLLMLSGTLMPHPLSLFLTLAFMLAWMDLFPRHTAIVGERARIPAGLLMAVAGLCLGLLALTRPLTAIGVAFPFLIHGLVLLVRGPRRKRWQAAVIALLVVAIAALMLLWQAALTGDAWLNLYTLWWPYDKVGFGPGFGHAEGGHNLRSAIRTMGSNMRAGMHDFFGWPYTSCLFLPFGMLALRRNRDGWMALAVFPSLVAIHLAYWVGSWLFGPRYYSEALPGLAIASALGIAWLGGWIGKATRWLSVRRRAVVVLVGLLLMVNLCMYLPPRLDGMRGLYGVYGAAVHPVLDADLGRALIIVHTTGTWYDYGNLVTLGPPYLEGDLLLAISRGEKKNAQLVQAFPDIPVYHYYVADESTFFEAQR